MICELMRRRRRLVFAGALLLLASLACAVSTAPEERTVHVDITRRLIVQTDLGYPALQIVYVVRNRTDRAVYVSRCGRQLIATLDRRESGAWVSYWSAYCLDVLTVERVALPPRAEIIDSATTICPGEYRIQVPYHLALDASDADSATSGPFTVDELVGPRCSG